MQARPSTGMETRTVGYWRWAGYAFLVLALLDLLEALIPPGFMNPGWELQFMGLTIERSPVALLGFLFVFHAEWSRRAKWERWLLPGVSWTALAAGVGFLLMIPLLVVNVFRLDASNEKQLTAQLDQQVSQAKALEDTVTAAQGENLEALLRRAGRQVDGADLEGLRQEMLTELAQAKQELQRRAVDARAGQKLELHKRTYKHVAQAFIVGGVLIALWFGTGWARKTRRKG